MRQIELRQRQRQRKEERGNNGNKDRMTMMPLLPNNFPCECLPALLSCHHWLPSLSRPFLCCSDMQLVLTLVLVAPPKLRPRQGWQLVAVRVDATTDKTD